MIILSYDCSLCYSQLPALLYKAIGSIQNMLFDNAPGIGCSPFSEHPKYIRIFVLANCYPGSTFNINNIYLFILEF